MSDDSAIITPKNSSGATSQRFIARLPTAALTIPVCLVLFGAVRRIHAEFKIDNDVV